jgi:biotin carboxyl carrier protein
MFKATVNDKTYDIVDNDGVLVIDGEPLNWDLAQIGPGYFHIIYKHRSFRAEITKTDTAAKTVTIRINSRIYTVNLRDKFDLLLEKMGMNNTATGKINNVKAPMPGLIVELKVKPGDAVNNGDALLILEAMKMENVLKAPGAGIVKALKVKKGDSVDKGQVLIEFS